MIFEIPFDFFHKEHYSWGSISNFWKLWTKMLRLWIKRMKTAFYKRVLEFYFEPITTIAQPCLRAQETLHKNMSKQISMW